jgi:hypothetical protein
MLGEFAGVLWYNEVYMSAGEFKDRVGDRLVSKYTTVGRLTTKCDISDTSKT